MFGKKFKKYFFDFFNLKIARTHFLQKLKNETFAKKRFLT
jgi:hypothetical protein